MLSILMLCSFCACSTTGGYFLSRDIDIDQQVVDDAVLNVSNSSDWCIGVPKIEIGDYKAGVNCNGVIVIHNGNDKERTIHLSYAVPNKGEPPPFECITWVTISLYEITLMPMETMVIPIDFMIPKTVENYPDKFEFHILAEEVGSNATVQIAYRQRWIISK